MKLVIIESPYAGDLERNLTYAFRAMLHSMSRGEAPFASHLQYTLFLDDKDPIERKLGIECGHAWMEQADLVVVYQDLGISPGMEIGIKRALNLGIPIEYRFIGEA
jgi:hypothetical protein